MRSIFLLLIFSQVSLATQKVLPRHISACVTNIAKLAPKSDYEFKPHNYYTHLPENAQLYMTDGIKDDLLIRMIQIFEFQSRKMQELIKETRGREKTAEELKSLHLFADALVSLMQQILERKGFETVTIDIQDSAGLKREVIFVEHYDLDVYSQFLSRIGNAFRVKSHNGTQTSAIYDPLEMAKRGNSGAFDEAGNLVFLNAHDFIDEMIFSITRTPTKHEYAHNGFAHMRAQGKDSEYHIRFIVDEDSDFKLMDHGYTKYMALEEIYTHAHNIYWETSRMHSFSKIDFSKEGSMMHSHGNINNPYALRNDVERMVRYYFGLVKMLEKTQKNIDQSIKDLRYLEALLTTNEPQILENHLGFDLEKFVIETKGPVNLKVPMFSEDVKKYQKFKKIFEQFEQWYGNVGFDPKIYAKNEHYKKMVDIIRGYQLKVIRSTIPKLRKVQLIGYALTNETSDLKMNIKFIRAISKKHMELYERGELSEEFLEQVQQSYKLFRQKALKFAKISRIKS